MPCDNVAVQSAALAANLGREILSDKAMVELLVSVLSQYADLKDRGRIALQSFRDGEAVISIGDTTVYVSESRIYGRGGYGARQMVVNNVVAAVKQVATNLARRLLEQRAVSFLQKKYVIKSDTTVGSVRMVKLTV